MIVGASCTAELIQDDPGGLAEALGLPMPGDPAGPALLPAARKTSARTRPSSRSSGSGQAHAPAPKRVTCNILGATALGFRHRDDVTEIDRAAGRNGHRGEHGRPAGRDARRHRPHGRRAFQRAALPRNRRNRRAPSAKRPSASPSRRPSPSASHATRDFLAEVAALAGLRCAPTRAGLRQPWWAASVDSTYLTGKRVFIFGDATHVIAAARIAAQRDRVRGRGHGLLQPRIGPPAARRCQGLRARGADHRRLSRGRGRHRRACSPN